MAYLIFLESARYGETESVIGVQLAAFLKKLIFFVLANPEIRGRSMGQP